VRSVPRWWTFAAVATSMGVLGLTGCGAHSSGGTAAPGGGSGTSPAASSTGPAKPLKVVSVTPHKLSGTGQITVTFASALSPQSPLPTLSPMVPGEWARVGSTAVFTPSGAYPPASTVTVHMARRASGKAKVIATATTPNGSLLRAEQILARLRYLPLTTSASPPVGADAEAAAVYDPPAGRFTWRYPDTPSTLKQGWSAGKPGIVLRGAVIAFQHQAGLPLDGSIGRHTWHALIKADLANDFDPDRYSFVSADLYLPQRLSVWVAGHTVLTSPVNGGVAAAPTPLGTYPVYERFTSTTMQGTNPDGTKYKDPGVPWVNYFSGGSAVHGFPRASYGFPQSVGCLELPIPTAAVVFKLINYGTLVNVSGPYVKPPPVATPAPPSTPTPKTSSTPTSKPSKSPKPSSTPKPSPTASRSAGSKPTKSAKPRSTRSPHPTH
jgi:peptidoglycan hydrolase-like protein with peptidoglycan-binding domain